jgi:cell division protein FtsB
MKRLIAGIMAGLLLGGCAGWGIFPGDRSPRGKLNEAVNALETGNEVAASKMLEEICRAPAVAGVTDEALFRLSMLSLRQHDNPAVMQDVRKRLERLRTEFPASTWTRLAWPFMEYLAGAEGVRSDLRTAKQRVSSLARENQELHRTNQNAAREIRELQETNQLLGKENRELSQRIEKMKHLELELERKGRR